MISLFTQNLLENLAAVKSRQSSPALHALGESEPVIDITHTFGIAQPLIAVRPVTHILSASFKVPGGYHRTSLDQDWRIVEEALMRLSYRLPLVSVGREFGAFEIIPGSHLAVYYRPVASPSVMSLTR